VWWKNATLSGTYLIVITGQSDWTAPGGLRLGLTLAELEKLNHKSFKLSGFDKKGVAAISDWGGGDQFSRWLQPPCSVSIQQSSEARCWVRGCGVASVAGASAGYLIRISLTVGLVARICGFEEAYSLFGDNAPIIFPDTFGSARRLSPAQWPVPASRTNLS
jgi:hypothetical protein